MAPQATPVPPLAKVRGRELDAAGNRDALVRAYDARSGTLLWQDQFNRAGRLDEVSFHTMAVEGARLFIGGRAGQASGNADWFVQGHDAVTGARLWQDFFDGASFDHTVTLAAQGDLVVAGGVTTDASITRHFTVRGYDAATGALRWHHQAATGMVGFFFATDVAWRVAVHGDRVVAAGSLADATGIHLAVRVLDAGTGAILWEDSNTGVLHGDQAFLAGVAGDPAGNTDWLVRVHELR